MAKHRLCKCSKNVEKIVEIFKGASVFDEANSSSVLRIANVIATLYTKTLHKNDVKSIFNILSNFLYITQ